MDYVLVTGSSSGIGEAIARRLVHDGFGVFLHGRSQSRLDQLKAELGPSVRVVTADLESPEGRADLVHEVEASGLPLKGLVNNAGVFSRLPALETTESEWRRQFEVNFFAPVLLAKSLYPLLKNTAPSFVVQISSTLGQKPVAQTAAYSASKAALLSWTECLALEWAKDGIRVNSICPGLVDTPIHTQGLVGLEGLQPLGRVGEPKDIAGMLSFLANKESSWITGSHFVVDGGIHLV